MVLSRLAVLGALLAAGCGQSLFDAHTGGRGDGGGPGDDDMPGTCTSCIADAAADFDGTATGKGAHWRYLEDQRNRFWTPMTGDGTTMTGEDTRNRITTCAAHAAAACNALPGALLVSSAGAAGSADPAIELTAPAAQAIRLHLRAAIASGDSQIRLYRGSREDALFTATVKPSTPVDEVVVVDSLPGDRFVVAIAPATGGGASDLALQLTAEPTGAVFPSTCQLALPFEARVGNTTRDVCGQVIFGLFKSSGAQEQLDVKAGPYFEQRDAAQIVDGSRLKPLNGKLLDHSHDLTVQFWVKLDGFAISNPAAWLFSDLDIEIGGGIGVGLLQNGPTLDVMGCTDPLTGKCVHATAQMPDPLIWHFVRVVHTRARIDACVDGVHVAGAADTSAALTPVEPPELGNQFTTQPGDAHVKGQLDDVRAITGALPCAE